MSAVSRSGRPAGWMRSVEGDSLLTKLAGHWRRAIQAGRQRPALCAGCLAAALLVVILLFTGRGGVEYGLSHRVLAANGAAVARIVIERERVPDPARLRVRLARGLVTLAGIAENGENASVEICLQAGYGAGEETVTVSGLAGGDAVWRLRLAPAPVDLDGDGIPDAAELGNAADRRRFRQWFCAIAESQFYRIWDTWIPEQRDCAGLVRFAMREALVVHDGKWMSRAGKLLLRSSIPDVAAFRYPEVPFLGTKLFRARTAAGGLGQDGSSFREEDFAPFVTAALLLEHNCRYLGKDPAVLEEGDLLFFDQNDIEVGNPDEAMHVMVWLGKQEGQGMLVYHTGDREKGEVRKIALATLAAHPDERWHPVAENPSFLGCYRLNILDNGTAP